MILISKSFTKAGVGSLAPKVPLLATPGRSVQLIVAIRGAVPFELTVIVYTSLLFKFSSEIQEDKPLLVIVSTAFFAFNNPQPNTGSGPISPASSAV